jgi:hypothetical protein
MSELSDYDPVETDPLWRDSSCCSALGRSKFIAIIIRQPLTLF